jgi:hypothetical protein
MLKYQSTTSKVLTADSVDEAVEYSKLSTEAKRIARRDYLKGWNKTHPHEWLSDIELDFLCECDTDTRYYPSGRVFG